MATSYRRIFLDPSLETLSDVDGFLAGSRLMLSIGGGDWATVSVDFTAKDEQTGGAVSGAVGVDKDGNVYLRRGEEVAVATIGRLFTMLREW